MTPSPFLIVPVSYSADIEARWGHPDRAAEQRRIADRMVYHLYGYTIGRGN